MLINKLTLKSHLFFEVYFKNMLGCAFLENTKSELVFSHANFIRFQFQNKIVMKMESICVYV